MNLRDLERSGSCFFKKSLQKAVAAQSYPQPKRKSRSNGGKRKDLNDKYFRSSWEANFARCLDFLATHAPSLVWEYEPVTFQFHSIKRGNRFYTPDFRTFDSDTGVALYYEIKGYMDPSSITKLKRMKKYYPEVKIILIDKYAYASLSRRFKKIVPNWE